MTRDEVIAILGILKTAYPSFYKDMTRDEMVRTIDLWEKMFLHEDPALVTATVENLINSFKWVPTIADIKEEMHKLSTFDDKSGIDYWNELEHATRNCLYKEKEIFEGLSAPVKRFLGNPSQLRELALSDAKTFQTVTKGQFLKQIEIIQKREKDNKMMLPSTKNILNQIASKMDVNQNLLN